MSLSGGDIFGGEDMRVVKPDFISRNERILLNGVRELAEFAEKNGFSSVKSRALFSILKELTNEDCISEEYLKEKIEVLFCDFEEV